MITAKDLYLTYDSNKYIIKRGNFSIKEKEFVFIGGNSGSGKSTLLKSFYGDIPIKHGSLKISNQEVFKIKGNNLRYLRKDIGVIFQDYKQINDYTIEENIMVPLTVGNPDNPIMCIGNLMCTGMEIKFPTDELSYGEFPTKVSFEVRLKPGMAKDRAGIETMFNMGRQRIYHNPKKIKISKQFDKLAPSESNRKQL